MKKVRGKAWVFGNNIIADTAIGYGATVGALKKPEELAKFCMIGYNPDFTKKAQKGDIIIAGRNFACGHLHIQFHLSLKGSGIGAVIAESFSRRYFRDGLNEGIPLLEVKDILKKVRQGDDLEISFENGLIKNHSTGETIQAIPLPAFLIEIVELGGLVPYLKKKRMEDTR
jgi:3-isopropylmalate/(R)-2-methylmalate dehydratase small subunit